MEMMALSETLGNVMNIVITRHFSQKHLPLANIRSEQTKSHLSEHKKIEKKCARACTCQKKVLPLQPIWRKNEKDTGQGPSVLVFAAVRGLDVQAFVPNIPLYRSGKYPA